MTKCCVTTADVLGDVFIYPGQTPDVSLIDDALTKGSVWFCDPLPIKISIYRLTVIILRTLPNQPFGIGVKQITFPVERVPWSLWPVCSENVFDSVGQSLIVGAPDAMFVGFKRKGVHKCRSVLWIQNV